MCLENQWILKQHKNLYSQRLIKIRFIYVTQIKLKVM